MERLEPPQGNLGRPRTTGYRGKACETGQKGGVRGSQHIHLYTPSTPSEPSRYRMSNSRAAEQTVSVTRKA